MTNKAIVVARSTYVPTNQISFWGDHNTAPVARLIQLAKKNNQLVDYTYGKPTRTAIFLLDGNIILSTVSTETIANRFNKEMSNCVFGDQSPSS